MLVKDVGWSAGVNVLKEGTYLSHSICILCIHILDNTRDLTFKLQLAAFLKIEARCVDDRKQHSVETRLAYLNTGSLNSMCCLC